MIVYSADGWSIGLFNKELSLAYNAALAGESPGWQPLPIQYADYAAWQQERLKGDGAAKEKEFWKKAVAGVPAILQMPTDRPRPEQPTGESGKFSGKLNSDLVHKIAAYASREKVGVQSVMLAAVQALLMRYSAQDDVVVGVPTAGRDRFETHGLIGYFINTVPVRAVAHEDTTFEEMVQDASAATLSALRNSHLPLQQVVELARVPRTPGANPLFQVRF